MIAPNNGTNEIETPPSIRFNFLAADEDVALSSLLFDPDFGLKYRGQLDIDLFSTELHASVARIALDQIDQGQPVNPEIVAQRLWDEGSFNQQSIDDEFSQLLDYGSFSQDRAIEALGRLHKQRGLNEIERAIREADAEICANPHADPQRISDRLTSRLASATPASISEPVTLAPLMISDPADESDETFQSGIDWLDSALPGGGFTPGDKLFMSAAPGVGKTALALQASISLLQTNPDLRIAWCAGEMTLKAIRNRALMCLSGLPMELLRRPWDSLSPLQADSKRDAIADLNEIVHRLSFVQAPLTIRSIEAEIIARQAAFVVIDFLQLVRPSEPGTSRREDMDGVIHEIERIAQQRGTVFWIISNMGKSGGTGKRDIFNCFKETSEIEYAADLAFCGCFDGVEDDADLPDVVRVWWNNLKARHGQQISFMTQFDRSCQRFTGVGG